MKRGQSTCCRGPTIASIAPVNYFVSAHSDEAALAARLLEMNVGSRTRLEATRTSLTSSGIRIDDFFPVSAERQIANVEELIANNVKSFDEACARDSGLLDDICRQVMEDAHSLWEAGRGYFAPVLYQTVMRSDASIEKLIDRIIDVGWQFNSWQVIGPAPEPFGHRVTLIQAIFSADRRSSSGCT
jgi:hypothetical protein